MPCLSRYILWVILASGPLVGRSLCCLAGTISSVLCEMRVCMRRSSGVGVMAGWLMCVCTGCLSLCVKQSSVLCIGMCK